MKKIVVVTTGGTIAMTEDKTTQSVKPIDPDLLKKALPLLDDFADVEMDPFSNVPSPHMTPEMMLRLSEHIRTYVNRSDVDGIVVTHGTDTLEETAYFLDLVLKAEKPIVVTGAMRGFNELGTDGPLNIVNAVRVAADPGTIAKGVLVVFNDEIHAARWVTKTHTSNVATFRSPQNGPLGILTKKGVIYNNWPFVNDRKLTVSALTHDVVLIKAAAGTDDLFFRAAMEARTHGIVLEALGQGNIPPQMVTGVKQAINSGIPVVMVSRCLSGIIQDIYGYEGGGKQLKEIGVIFSNGLNGQKARIKLLLALEHTHSHTQLQNLFND